jgi:hypothetical protein
MINIFLKVRQDEEEEEEEEEEVWMLLSLLTGTKFAYYRAVYTDTTKMPTNTVVENKEE